MKKILILFSICLLGMGYVNNDEEIIIPSEAIRFRIIAKSNSETDQKTKKIVKESLEKELDKLLVESTSINETRTILKSNQEYFKNIINNTLLTNKLEPTYQINYGLNYFPQKEFKGITYEEGYYESLVVTLGEGKGDNWWCVLFPPLCLIEEDTNNTKVEYKSYVKEMIEKYF